MPTRKGVGPTPALTFPPTPATDLCGPTAGPVAQCTAAAQSNKACLWGRGMAVATMVAETGDGAVHKRAG